MTTDTTGTTDSNDSNDSNDTRPTTDETPAGAPRATWAGVSFDCADPAALSRFWGEALSLSALHTSDDFILLGSAGSPGLGFCRIDGYEPPTWPTPEREKQAHLEIGVEDLDAGQARMLALGATEPPSQPSPDRWRVLLDPAGHPFCLFVQA
ncbi:VOC family protein [Streptomyces avicenniae]|uniref:VOC family protein n=1 Tax=Streptomyces avicenniae TaxID=500153 RepID=UPI00167EB0A9|nr:VOC family protein [Streptomyces avicenniae]